MRKDLVRRLVTALGTVGLLAGAGTVYSENKTSQEITIQVLPFRRLFVNEDNQIIGVAQMADQSYENVDVIKNKVEIPMTPEIREQYFLLQNPEIASGLGINWANNHFWNNEIDPTLFNSLQETFLQKTLEDTVKDNLNYSINGNRKVSVDYSFPNSIIYTITEQ